MDSRYLADQLRWPAPASPRRAPRRGVRPGLPSVPADTVLSTLALFDAIEMDHEVLVGFALDKGARLDARVVPSGRTEAQSPLARAVHRACWDHDGPNGQAWMRLPTSPVRSRVVERLVHAGAQDLDALQGFPKEWLVDGSGLPLHDPMVLAVEASGLDAIMTANGPHPAFRFFDDAGEPLSARARLFAKPHESWLSVAARHQRADVVQHWFANGGTLNAPGLMVFRSPLAEAWRTPLPGQADDPRARDLLVQAWLTAPDALFRQELLHLVVEQLRAPAPVAARIQQVLEHAVERRPTGLRLSADEHEAIKIGALPGTVEKRLESLENAVLRHALRDVPDDGPRARPRL